MQPGMEDWTVCSLPSMQEFLSANPQCLLNYSVAMAAETGLNLQGAWITIIGDAVVAPLKRNLIGEHCPKPTRASLAKS